MPELVIISVIALMVFYPAILPDLGRPLGEAVRCFRTAIKDGAKNLKSKHQRTRPGKLSFCEGRLMVER